MPRFQGAVQQGHRAPMITTEGEEVVEEEAQQVRTCQALCTEATPPRGSSTPSSRTEPKWKPRRMPVPVTFRRSCLRCFSIFSDFLCFEIRFFLSQDYHTCYWWWETICWDFRLTLSAFKELTRALWYRKGTEKYIPRVKRGLKI